MSAKVEVSKQLRTTYRGASKAEKSKVLDSFCESTGLGRSTARRYLTSSTIGVKNVARLDPRKARVCKYSLASRRMLVYLWRLMGFPCGKYMAVDIGLWIDSLRSHGELVEGKHGWSQDVEHELVAMSASTIDRYLREERKRLELKGISTTKPGALLRNSISIRKAGDQMASEPGFFRSGHGRSLRAHS